MSLSTLILWLGAFVFLAVDATYTCKDRTTPPAGSICRQNGTVSKAKDEHAPATILNSFNACRDLAHSSSSYESFSWHTVNRHCHLYLTNLTAGAFKANSSSVVEFSDTACSSCTAVCPPPVGVNQLINGGFELSRHYIGPWQPNIFGDPFNATVVLPGKDSNHALLLPNSFYATTEQPLRYLCPGSEYLFSADFKSTDPNQREADFVADIGYGHEFSIGMPTVSNITWTTYQNYLVTPVRDDGEDVDISIQLFRLSPTPSWLLDNIGLYPVNPPVIKAGAKEILVNGGFESGFISPWSVVIDGNCSIHSPGLNGSLHLLSLKFEGSEDGESPEGASITQPVSLVEGAHYLIALDYKLTQDIFEGTISITIASGNDVFNDMIEEQLGVISIQKKGLGTIRHRFIANGFPIKLLRINVEGGYRPYPPIYIDNISIKEVEKPSFS